MFSEYLNSVKSHPVHLITKDGKVSPSALIPFCEFGGDMASLGTMTKWFPKIPVCTSFQAKMLNNQLCYKIDLNHFSKKSKVEKELKLGFYFVMDYNEDRQTITDDKNVNGPMIISEVLEVDPNQHAFMYLNTIGRYILFISKS